ncbi:MAG TPA: RDD family protein [Steroidobacteraceae bacterium]|nr:RDD family protein [Steroidobacteraceae bacterium]
MQTQPAPPPAGLLRRLAAIVYDALLLVALAMVATSLLLPLTGGEAITTSSHPALGAAYRALLVGIVIAFYGLFWTRRGQTLGMQSWRLKVERQDGGLLEWSDVIRRLAAALLSLLALGLGFLWILVDPGKRAWHDMLSGTRVVLVPKHQRPKRPA